MTPKMQISNGLEYLHVPGNSDSAFVILHGFGADAYDLYSLHEVMKAEEGAHWYFPNGTLRIPFGGGWEGRGWFPISVSGKLQQAISTGDWSEVAKFEPPGLEEAFQKINEFINSLPHKYSHITIGGFSQGAMLSLELFLRRKDLPARLILFSGTLLHSEKWKALAQEKKGFRFFQSHGTKDNILPYAAAIKLNSLLREAGMDGELYSFPDGHTIPMDVIEKVNSYLSQKN